ncbi:MAG TPA: aspartate/glutamate racemase family protein, partial [Hyphomicrobiales bacterium]|nr:aspartate/glutamate racemase family protein [Hyphomicrobiales bacterium]
KPAAQLSQRGVVGVLATSGTIASDKFFRLQDRFVSQVQIVTRACPGLVELIEADVLDKHAIEQALRGFTAPMVERQADVLVLGCTHYSLIRELIQQVVGPGVRIVDAGLAVARETRRRLEQEDLLASADQVGSVRFFTSGELAHQRLLLARYWGGEPVVEALPAA